MVGSLVYRKRNDAEMLEIRAQKLPALYACISSSNTAPVPRCGTVQKVVVTTSN